VVAKLKIVKKFQKMLLLSGQVSPTVPTRSPPASLA
jgi:hypothetical protein